LLLQLVFEIDQLIFFILQLFDGLLKVEINLLEFPLGFSYGCFLGFSFLCQLDIFVGYFPILHFDGEFEVVQLSVEERVLFEGFVIEDCDLVIQVHVLILE
jgi:hypothetical protein